MNPVLRKKVLASGGLSPSVLNAQAFWARVSATMARWAGSEFALETPPAIESRKGISGKAIRERLQSGIGFCFAETASPGLAGLLIDPAVMHTYASRRLKQDLQTVAISPPLFLKLLFEQPVTALWSAFAGWLAGHRAVQGAAPMGDPALATRMFADGARFVEVQVRLGEPGSGLDVSLLMHPAFLNAFAPGFAPAREEKAAASGRSRELLRDSACRTHVELSAVLGRMELTIGQCSRLSVGQVVPLAGGDPDHLVLCTETVDGTVDIGEGVLGIFKKQRAIRLSAPIGAGLVEDIGGRQASSNGTGKTASLGRGQE